MGVAFRQRRPIGGSTQRGGHTQRGPLEPVLPVPAFVLDVCQTLAEAFRQDLWPSSAPPSDYFNIIELVLPSGFVADPDEVGICAESLDDQVMEKEQAAPSGFVKDTTTTRPTLADLP